MPRRLLRKDDARMIRGSGTDLSSALFSFARAPGLARGPDRPRERRPHEAAEGGAFEVAGRRAGGGVLQPVAHGGELADRAVELLRLRGEQLAIDVRPSVGREHAGDLVEGEAGGAAE